MSTRFGAVERDLQRAVTRAMREMGRAIFEKSQGYVPVQSGDLRDSGRFVEIPGGFKIRYTEPYAARREHGIEAGRRITVRRHRVGGFIGAAGRRAGGRMRGPYTYETRGEQGSHYLQRAIDEEQPTFGRRVARHLKLITGK